LLLGRHSHRSGAVIPKQRRDKIKFQPMVLRHSALTWSYLQWQVGEKRWRRFPTLDSFLKHLAEIFNTSPDELRRVRVLSCKYYQCKETVITAEKKSILHLKNGA